MKDDLTRITIAQWNKLKSSIPPETTPNPEFTPHFGYIVDSFRNLYKICISVTPTSDNGEFILGYRSVVCKLSGNNIENFWTGSELSYYLAMRNAIDKAYEFINE